MLRHLGKLVDRPLAALMWAVATLAGLVLWLLGRRPSRTATSAPHVPIYLILLLVVIVQLAAMLIAFAIWKLIDRFT